MRLRARRLKRLGRPRTEIKMPRQCIELSRCTIESQGAVAMVGKWLQNRINRWSLESQTEEFQRFNLSLKGQSRAELGFLVAMATVVRLDLQSRGVPLDRAIGVGMPLSLEHQASMPVMLNRLIKEFQSSDNMAQAAGAMVWLFTTRALLTPELRFMGRQMWLEL